MKIEIDEDTQCIITREVLKEDYGYFFKNHENEKLKKAFRKVLKYYMTESDYKEFIKQYEED